MLKGRYHGPRMRTTYTSINPVAPSTSNKHRAPARALRVCTHVDEMAELEVAMEVVEVQEEEWEPSLNVST